jgi:hypothetical protein
MHSLNSKKNTPAIDRGPGPAARIGGYHLASFKIASIGSGIFNAAIKDLKIQ